jgi:hypothetical protein
MWDGEEMMCTLCDWRWEAPDRITMIRLEETRMLKDGEHPDVTRRKPGRPKKVSVPLTVVLEYEWENI